MKDNARQVLRRVLTLLVAGLLVVGLVPALPEPPFALAEGREATVELGEEGLPSGDDAEQTGVSVVEDVSDDGADAQPLGGRADASENQAADSSGGDVALLDEDVEAALLDELALAVQEEDSAFASDASADSKSADGTGQSEDEATLGTQAVSVSNPRVRVDSSMAAGQVATWDCVWFGSYPQTEVTSADAAYASLALAGWDANGDATVGGARYRRISKSDATYSGYWSDDGYGSATYRYFRWEPIKWRVLKVSGSTALVVADRALDDQRYNTNYTSVTWATSSVRSWLNGYGAASNQPQTDFSYRSFIGTAFSSAERSAILQTNVVNANNTYYNVPGGDDTRDRVFLLSESEVYDTTHGFASSYSTHDEARRCRPTDFARAMGAWKSTSSEYLGNCWWWLRSPGHYSSQAAGVYFGGVVDRDGGNVNGGVNLAVRPALNLNLASAHLSWAGTVSSDGTVNEQETIGSGDIGVHKGTCGDLLDWKLEKGVLTISGFGKMTSHPWSQFKNEITSVTLPWGALNICDGAFQGCGSLASASVPSSLEEVGDSAFDGCSSLEHVYYFGAGEYIDQDDRKWSDIRIGQLNEPLLNATVTWARGAVKKKVYDAPLYVRTPEDKVQQAAFAFEAASNDYIEAVRKTAEEQTKKARSKCKKTNGELLEEVGGDRSLNMLTLNPQMPKACKKAAYSGFAKYLDKYVEKGTGIIGGIDVSTDYISVSASTVNWIRMNLNNWADDEFMVDGHNVSIHIACNWGSAGVGYLTVDGLYMSSICTTPEDTAKVLSAYLNKLKEASLDAAYNVLTSVCGEFADATGISSWTKDKITSFLKNKVNVLKSKGFGDVLESMICAREGVYLSREILIASDTVSIAKALTNPKALADSITSIDLTDEGVTEMLVKRAIKRLKQARDVLAKSIYDYAVDPKKQEVKPWFDEVLDGFKDLGRKIITCECPVDVYVYDVAGNELGHVADGEVVCGQQIAMKLDGDVKTVVVPSDVEASIRLVGTDEGEMTYVVEQVVDGDVTGRANWYGVPLSKGASYVQTVSGEPLTGKSKVALKSNDGVSIKASEYLSASDSASVQIQATTEGGGSVVGSDTYAIGSPVALWAYPQDEHHRFSGWYQGDELVCTSSPYRFPATEDALVTARFEEVRIADERYAVKMAPAYKDSCAVAVCRNASGKTDVMVGMSGYEGAEPKTLTLRKYQAGSVASMAHVKTSDQGMKCIFLGGLRFDSERADLLLPDGSLLCAIFPIGKEREVEDETLVGGFSDVTDKVAHHEDIAWLASSGISEGWAMPDGTRQFRPYASIARADMAAFLFRLARQWGLADDSWRPSAEQRRAFSDVTERTPHAREIWWLAANGISNGTRVGDVYEFRPYEDVIRRDMAAFLFRLSRLDGRGGAVTGWEPTTEQRSAFADVGPGTIHATSVWWLASTGVSEGWAMPDGTRQFRPASPVARADMAAFLHRLDGLKR